MLVPAIPTLIKDFNITYGTSSWILTTYLLTGAVMTPIAAKLSDILAKMLAPRCQFSKLSRG
jgi:MFS family permease